MGTFLFLFFVAIVFAMAIVAKTAWGEGLVDEARQWWKLRSMQVAAIIALVPQFLAEWIEYLGALWPDAQALVMQVLPGYTANTLTVVGALFALSRLFKQRSQERPRWPSADDTAAPSA